MDHCQKDQETILCNTPGKAGMRDGICGCGKDESLCFCFNKDLSTYVCTSIIEKSSMTKVYNYSLKHERLLNVCIHICFKLSWCIFAYMYIQYLLYESLKMLLNLFSFLFISPPQNAPAIPSQLVMSILCLLRGSKLIVDYHNYGYSILALTLGPKHILVTITRL